MRVEDDQEHDAGFHGFSERRNNKITFPEISGKILEKVCQYFYYKLQYTDSRDPCPSSSPAGLALILMLPTTSTADRRGRRDLASVYLSRMNLSSRHNRR